MRFKIRGKREFILLTVIMFFMILVLSNYVMAQQDPWVVKFSNSGVNPIEPYTGIANDVVSIPIYIEEIGGLLSWHFVLSFDPNLVTFLGIDPAGYSGMYYTTLPLVDAIGQAYDPGAGEVGGVQVGGILNDLANPPPVSGEGLLCNAVFRIDGDTPGACQIRLWANTDPTNLIRIGGVPAVLYALNTIHVLIMENYAVIDPNAGILAIPLTISDCTDLDSFLLTVMYDTNILSLQDVVSGNVGNYTMEYSELPPGSINIGAFENGPCSGSGELLRMVFQVEALGVSFINISYPIDPLNPLGALSPISGSVSTESFIDRDGDSWTPEAGDCNDDDNTVYPGAAELCNGIDDDCDALTPDGDSEAWFGTACDGQDTDLCSEGQYQCIDGNQICSDNTDDTIEVCDGIDNDCDTDIDEGVMTTFYFDNDGDGFGDSNITVEACAPPQDYVALGDDCNDNDNRTYPDAPARKDGVDRDCSGILEVGEREPIVNPYFLNYLNLALPSYQGFILQPYSMTWLNAGNFYSHTVSYFSRYYSPFVLSFGVPWTNFGPYGAGFGFPATGIQKIFSGKLGLVYGTGFYYNGFANYWNW